MEDGLDGERLVVLFWALPPRHRQVMYLFVQGKSPPDIAEYLYIKEKTVRQYLRDIAKVSGRLGTDGKLKEKEG
ncbi:MAG: hypothetical protein GQ524_01965 [Anaerolineales bacterium]|nr:hypothetical protein [Anaerolineales bacterium]